MGGVTLLDGTLTKTQGGRYDGKEAQGTPDFRVVAGSEWDTPFMRGLTLTGRATFSDGQYVSNTSYTLQIPSWHRLDLGLRYAFASPWSSKPVVIRFNVENALGDSYWVTGYAGTAALSDPRTYLLSTTFTF